MNELYIENTVFQMSEEKTQKLLASSAIYPCEEHGGFHLDPTHNFALGDVICLMLEE